MTEEYEKRKQFSEEIIKSLRHDISENIKNLGSPSVCVVTAGSFARREACEDSDIDYFILYPNKSDKEIADQTRQKLHATIYQHVPKPPSTQGAFNVVELNQDMLDNIGGSEDENSKLTRRILTLLEGDWLYDENAFLEMRKTLIARYLQDIEKGQIARFLLSDFIRYYRTVCVDFEFKTKEGNKPWGIRNIKLVFSRKLLYFSGIASIAETSGLDQKSMTNELNELLGLPVCERLKRIFGEDKCENVFEIYNEFLEAMSSPKIREELEGIDRESRKESENYKILKSKGYDLTDALKNLICEKFNSDHPVHKALVF